MVRSAATTPEEYLAELPEDRRATLGAVRDLIRANLPEGFEETMNWGMLAYEVPLERYPDTYNGQPLGYIGLAAQKNNYALYLHGLYMDEARRAAFEEGFRSAGKKLDMGKSCLRFKSLDDLPLDVVADAVRACEVEDFLEMYEQSRKG